MATQGRRTCLRAACTLLPGQALPVLNICQRAAMPAYLRLVGFRLTHALYSQELTILVSLCFAVAVLFWRLLLQPCWPRQEILGLSLNAKVFPVLMPLQGTAAAHATWHWHRDCHHSGPLSCLVWCKLAYSCRIQLRLALPGELCIVHWVVSYMGLTCEALTKTSASCFTGWQHAVLHREIL